MKRILFFIASFSLLCFYSCGGGNTSTTTSTSSDTEIVKPEKVDFMMLAKPEGLKKAYDMVVAKLDTNIRYVDKISMSINNYPQTDSDDGDTRLSLTVIHLNNKNKNQLTQYRYFSSQGKWEDPEIMVVELTPGSDAESFVLQDQMLDLSGLTYEKLNKQVQDAFNKFKDEGKYNFQYVSDITITEFNSDREPNIHIFMKGQLKSNDMIKDENVTIPLRRVLP